MFFQANICNSKPLGNIKYYVNPSIQVHNCLVIEFFRIFKAVFEARGDSNAR